MKKASVTPIALAFLSLLNLGRLSNRAISSLGSLAWW